MGLKFTTKAVRTWLSRLGVRTLYIEPGSLVELTCEILE
jgi:hypothetical protein